MARYRFKFVYRRFNDSDAAESNDAVGPSASATVDKFEAVPGDSFLAMLRCPQHATIARESGK